VRGHVATSVLLAVLTASTVAVARSDLRPGFSRAACSAPPFPIDALTSPTGAQRADSGSARALRNLIRDPSSDPYIEGPVPKGQWRLLLSKPRYALYGAGDAVKISPLGLRKTNQDRWSFADLDTGCRPRVLRDRLSAETWRLDSAAPAPSPSSTDLALLVGERNCNGGEPPDQDRIRPAIVDYGGRAITITYFVDPPEGAQTCPGAPPARVTLSLDEALGDRVLSDGGMVIPRQRFPKRSTQDGWR
jgi:hypothetical protein